MQYICILQIKALQHIIHLFFSVTFYFFAHIRRNKRYHLIIPILFI